MGILSNYIVPTLFTVLLHILVVFTVLIGWQLSDTHRFRVDTPRYVKAELVTLEQKQKQPKAEPAAPVPVAQSAPQPDSEPSEEEAAAPPETESSADAAVSTSPDPAIERQRQLEREQEQQRQREQELRRQREEEYQRHLKQQRASEKRAQEKARQRQQQQALQRAMQEEETLMQAEQDEVLADSYAALVKRTVESHWSRPPSARKDMQVELAIRLVPTGEVVGVEVTRSSGNTSFDRSAVLAVKKAGRFPELKDMPSSVFEQYFRSFTLVFKPEDLLL